MGGRQGASVFIRTLSSQMKRLCCHTPPRSCHNLTRQQVNTVSAHLKSGAPVSHQVPNCSIRNSEVSIEQATKLEDLENKGGPAGTAKEL